MANQPETAPVPPQNLDAEESILGAIMLSPGAIEAVGEILNPTGADFYRESHARIYLAAVALHSKGEPVDAVTLVDELEKRGELENVGGRSRIHELAALVPATANAAHYARIVSEMATLRGLIRVADEIGRLGWERPGETPDLLDKAEQVLFELTQSRDRAGDMVSAGDAIREAYDRLVELSKTGRDVIGVSTGFGPIDHLTSGLQPGNLVTLASRPSMGKTGLALGVAANAAIRASVPVPVALFTLEMSRSEVMQRLMSSEGLVDSQKVRNGRNLAPEDWERLNSASARLQQAPIFVNDSGLITVGEIRSKARRLKLRGNLGLLIVDYLQLMATEGSEENRVQQVSKISRSLKVLARELDVPVLALSQLSRAVEQRHDKRPILSDLRESGAIEQDSDVVMFLYRDEYYHPEDTDQHGIAEINVAKQRNGPTGTVKLSFVKRYARFSDPPLPGTGGTG
jgi:replicative DNA helicase